MNFEFDFTEKSDAVWRFYRSFFSSFANNSIFLPSSPPSVAKKWEFSQMMMERIQYPFALPQPEYHVSCRGLLYEV